MTLWWWFRQYFSHVSTINELCMCQQPFYKVSFLFVEHDLHLWPLSYCKQLLLWQAQSYSMLLLIIFTLVSTEIKSTWSKRFIKLMTSSVGNHRLTVDCWIVVLVHCKANWSEILVNSDLLGFFSNYSDI